MKKGFRIVKFKKSQPVLEVRDLTKSFDAGPNFLFKYLSSSIVITFQVI